MSSIPIHYKSIEEIQNSYINKPESPLSVTNHFLERIQNIDKQVPKIWQHAPHPSNDRNMPKTTRF